MWYFYTKRNEKIGNDHNERREKVKVYLDIDEKDTIESDVMGKYHKVFVMLIPFKIFLIQQTDYKCSSSRRVRRANRVGQCEKQYFL